MKLHIQILAILGFCFVSSHSFAASSYPNWVVPACIMSIDYKAPTSASLMEYHRDHLFNLITQKVGISGKKFYPIIENPENAKHKLSISLIATQKDSEWSCHASLNQDQVGDKDSTKKVKVEATDDFQVSGQIFTACYDALSEVLDTLPECK